MQAPLREQDPRRLGGYRLTGRLGRGGMGTVFLGEDASGRQVAVKVINPELADDEAFHERFRREVTAARQVRRFCTAAVLDARLDGEPLYVVTEYVNGPPLDRAVRDGGPLAGGDLEGLAVNIATALGAIHGAGIVHRDLKPSNVLLSPTGPRVIDFGIARALDATDGPTRTGQFIGTPAYVAPELMHGEEITPAADVFSWGCVVAYAGTGRAPFGGATVPETMRRVMSAPPVLDGLDPAVRDLVRRTLAKDPAERPTVKQLVQALTGEEARPAPETHPTRADPVSGTRPVATAPAPPRPAGGRPAGGRPAGGGPGISRRRVGVIIVAVAAVVAGGAAIGLLNADGEDSGGTKPPSAASSRGSGGKKSESTAPFRDDFGDRPPKTRDKLFSDRFDDEKSGWNNSTYAAWDMAYRGGKYEVQVLPTTNRTTADAPVDDVPDAQLVEAEVKPDGGTGEAGLFCHRHGDLGYAFLLRSDGRARIVKMESGEVKDMATRTATGVRPGRLNRVQAACAADGDTVRLGMWVNGDPVAKAAASDAYDDTTTSGLLVMRPEDDAGWPKAVFDDFSLSSI
ncbi:serine/threonine-protein kinase [Actinomadura rubrisoli]|uniref:Serine/threonine protein kinase n=1 Tax=Actinomadura rubrisoli TaxID=2530368 RepID=A0A4R5BXP0_9ACTN|nr:serine/threonine-protein kinase [Actinomadura rubrisoli]TDD89134.1 serine/threonine protein kinase [Actinomadura rubrisoli]